MPDLFFQSIFHVAICLTYSWLSSFTPFAVQRLAGQNALKGDLRRFSTELAVLTLPTNQNLCSVNPAFNGDRFIEFELNFLVKKWSIQTIIETGTYRGDSTQALAKLGPDVVTIEMDWERFSFATELDKIRHITRFHGDSPAVLRRILPDTAGPILFYLDAHWSAHSPLLEELGAIGLHQNLSGDPYPVIAIHDFFNPNHPDYAFDAWDIGEYRLALVSDLLNAIYGAQKWIHHFNDESAAEPKRGILYVEPC